jgi:hypothetical protein
VIIVWAVSNSRAVAHVHEDGHVISEDGALRERLLAALREPVEVSRTGGGGKQLTLQPQDRRYVVARIRRLVEDEPDLEIVDLYFRG